MEVLVYYSFLLYFRDPYGSHDTVGAEFITLTPEGVESGWDRHIEKARAGGRRERDRDMRWMPEERARDTEEKEEGRDRGSGEEERERKGVRGKERGRAKHSKLPGRSEEHTSELQSR